MSCQRILCVYRNIYFERYVSLVMSLVLGLRHVSMPHRVNTGTVAQVYAL